MKAARQWRAHMQSHTSRPSTSVHFEQREKGFNTATRYCCLKLFNHIIDVEASEIDCDDVCLSRVGVKKSHFVSLDIRSKFKEDSLKGSHFNSKRAKCLLARLRGQRVRNYTVTDKPQTIREIANALCRGQVRGNRVDASMNVDQREYRAPTCNLSIDIVGFLAILQGLSVLPKREQDREESRSRSRPSAHCSDGNPVEPAVGGGAEAGNQYFSGNHHVTSVWIGRHSAMRPRTRAARPQGVKDAG